MYMVYEASGIVLAAMIDDDDTNPFQIYMKFTQTASHSFL